MSPPPLKSQFWEDQPNTEENTPSSNLSSLRRKQSRVMSKLKMFTNAKLRKSIEKIKSSPNSFRLLNESLDRGLKSHLSIEQNRWVT